MITTSGETSLHETQFDNGLTFNDVIHVFPVPELPDLRETSHFNNHVVDHSLQENTNTLLDAIQQPQADLTNLQQAAADTVNTFPVRLGWVGCPFQFGRTSLMESDWPH